MHPVLDFALPTVCFACGAALGPTQLLGACATCWTAFVPLVDPLCDRCGLPRPAGTDLLGPARGRCAECLLRPGPLYAVRGTVTYDEHARRFLLRAKLGRRREMFRPLGEQVLAMISACGWAEGCTVVVPAPSHPWAAFRRGFCPARELSRVIADGIGVACLPRGLRMRVGSPLASKRLSAARRRAARESALLATCELAGESVLLVDDVMTTGATVAACARELTRAGARDVRVAVWGRTLHRV